jgi:hypothetical protein
MSFRCCCSVSAFAGFLLGETHALSVGLLSDGPFGPILSRRLTDQLPFSIGSRANVAVQSLFPFAAGLERTSAWREDTL